MFPWEWWHVFWNSHLFPFPRYKNPHHSLTLFTLLPCSNQIIIFQIIPNLKYPLTLLSFPNLSLFPFPFSLLIITTMQFLSFSFPSLISLHHYDNGSSIAFLFLATFSLIIFLFVHRRRSSAARGRNLPPGSMGWPYIGETLRLYAENPNSFFSDRQKRYIYNTI